MKVSRHIHYTQNPDICLRQELKFDPPLEIESTLGKIDPLYPGVDFTIEGRSNRCARTAPVINKNGLLDITEIMEAGEVLSMELRPGERLDKVVLAEEHQLQMFAGNEGLLYFVTIGKRGAVRITGKVIPDKDNFLAKLKADLTDTAMRDYLAGRSLANSKVAKDAVENVPDYLTAEEAWTYLKIGRTRFFQLVSMKKIKRGPNQRYSKKDLDRYFESEKE